ncbi:E3 ubiquitin-protein ligase RZF1 [Balamuthia mandrillaris]
MQQGHGSNGGAATNGGMGVGGAGSPSGGGGGRRLLLFLELRTRAPSPYAASSPSLPFSALSFGPSNNNSNASPATPSQPPLRQVVVLIDSVPLVPGASTSSFTGGGGLGISLLGGLGGSTTATAFGSNLMAEALASLVSSATSTTASDDAEESSFQRLLDRLRELHPPAGPPPASREALDGLPSLRVHAHLKEEAVRCPVCFEDFVVGRRVLALPCRHVFDKECVVPWLKQHNTCPVCRYELPVADPQADRERKARMQAERGVDEAAFFASKGRNLFKKKTTSASASVAASSSTSTMVVEEKEKKEKTTQRRSRRIAASTRKAKREEEEEEAAEEEHEEEKPKKRRASRRQHNKDKGKEKEAHSPSSVNQTMNEADVRHHQKRSKAAKTLKRKRSSVEQAENDVLHDSSSAPTTHGEDIPSNNDDSLGFFGRLKRKASKAIAHATGREKQSASSSSSSSSSSASSSGSQAPAYNTRSKKSRRTNNE